ncbi:NUDIX hydrolase [Agilicoccus flavus]|uniref:NUDIX hydrolase n=1 Tax=Agilicoccus flavus TaxID=2775968 RepID=UPI001CF6D3CD|nr:NUDIX domain-containing protein [Agilicoccus flavus]
MPIPDFITELRRHVGTAPLWLTGATAVVLREVDGRPHVLLVRRADSGRWAPVSGIVDPGEHPHVTAERETLEEACVVAVAERLAWVSVTEPVTYDNGDRATYLDHTFACRWVSGEPAVGDDESLEARFFPADDLPDLPDEFAARVRVALAGRAETGFGPLPGTPGRSA